MEELKGRGREGRLRSDVLDQGYGTKYGNRLWGVTGSKQFTRHPGTLLSHWVYRTLIYRHRTGDPKVMETQEEGDGSLKPF